MQTKIRFAPALIAALVAGAVFAADKPVAVVNGVAIPQSQMDFILKQLAERGAKDSPDLRAKIRDDLITKEVIAQEATKQGLDKNVDVQTEMAMARQNVLLKSFVQGYQKTAVIPEATLKAEYDKLKAQAGGGKEYSVRHILVKTEAEAKAVIADLKKGKKFADLAKAKSQDPGSKDNGGLYDKVMEGQFVPEFDQAMRTLAKGQVTQAPVKTQYGFHVIKLEDVRTAQGPSFDEVKGNIQQQMQGQALDKMIADLRAKAKVE
ncbi:peptidylprolyl isomerase [Chitinimonas taiwanensis]|uniref:peptidylprolyl isomerase n=1 Tax=Chitinimonas taiwanensis DSM 18899 TaxID=1121279 RepID=A0A1K2HLT9_9NEIS|nr:peptidylprolyl isomerase [Chitinimonas taiwanensis]SFZ77683.1 peptidyl-prolyl cis-trans isomerase C [Chitinimonas taiwanensis DSM 18899]